MTDNKKIIEEVIRKNNLSSTLNITRYTSGIIHSVYDLENHVLKIEGDEDYAKGVIEYQQGFLSKLFSIGAKVPKVVDSGTTEAKPYLLMEKLRGTNIVYGWRNFDMKQKENFVAQLAEELKKYHSIKSSEYSIPICSETRFTNFEAALRRVINFDEIKTEDLPNEHRNDVEWLKRFYNDNMDSLNEKGTAVFIHNDIHLENIFYENDQITGIIDFDWSSYAPRDYELRQIVETFRSPKYTVEERLEPLYENYQMIEEFSFLKKYYPDLFEQDNLVTRVRLYYLRKILGRIVDFQKGTWKNKDSKALQIFSEEMRDIYKTDWLDKFLQ